MKIKFIEIKQNEKISFKESFVKIGDVIDLPKERAESFVARGKAEIVKETPKQTKSNSKE